MITRDDLQARWDAIFDSEIRVCVYCDNEVRSFACPQCGEYKGLMSIEDWESYTGESWL